MNVIDKTKEVAKKFINAIKNAMKKIASAIKFFVSPIGYVCGWLILIAICVLLIYVIIQYVSDKVAKVLYGESPNYKTFEEDIGYIKDLTYSGYEATINAENFQNFQAFEYAVLMDAAEYLRQEDNIESMQVAFETNQALLSKKGQDRLDELVEKGIKARSLKVEVEEPSINVSGSVSGGNTKVVPATLVYEFKNASVYRYSSGDSGDKNATTEELLAAGKLKGSLEPYVYIIREDIDFTYYFNQNNDKNAKRVVEYKYELNVNNPYMTGSGSEFLKDLSRHIDANPNAEIGTVTPGQSYSTRIYYTDETTPVIYKIPLRTLIGRYMPKLELLQAWAVLKQDIDKEDNMDEVDLVDEIIACIKGIYNEACLEGETFTVKSGEDVSGEITYYSDATTHTKTFATFETAGIEKTLYGINGLKAASGQELKVFTDCVNATIIEATTVTAEIQYEDGTVARQTFNVSDLVSDAWINHGCVIAEEAGNGKYVAPSSFESTGICAVGESVGSVTSKMEANIKAKLGGDSAMITEVRCDFRGAVREGAAFKFEDQSPTDTLGVEHTRMPIVLVKSAITWARNITYTHTLTQNGFDQNNKYYIIPNSVSSLGLMNFQSSQNENSYRGKAYTEIFARMKEKDVLNVLFQLEKDATAGTNDCYEFMRDVYKLLQASKEYSVKHPTDDITKNINPETYNYLYIPDTVLYYDDSQTQKIYWIDLFTAVQTIDAITADELKNVRTKKNELTWQVVEYEKYPECSGEDGKTKVYAINPFNSSYLRAYYQRSYEEKGIEGNIEIHGNYGDYAGTDHSGADWGGRSRINDIYAASSSESVTGEKYAKDVYDYELNRLTKIYDETKAKELIKSELSEQKSYLPIVAVAPGVVESVTYSSRSGIYVKIKHTSGDTTDTVSLYMHLKRWPLVDEGDYVGAGTLLGYEGETGRAFGSHLHFQINKGGTVSPAEYIYPSFNPFYYEEKAAEDGYDLKSEYMSLYRTVTMANDGEGVTNQHPTNALVDDVKYLIQNQGEFDKTTSMSGDIGWNSQYSDSEEYMNYLKKSKYYDLYIKEVYQDYNLAKAAGYLELPSWLYQALGGMDFIVNTEMPGSLPELTREELVHILENWLPARYGEAKIHGMTKVEWLMKNVFTDETIDKIIESQNEYHVSAVFALAVATIEQNMGLSGTKLALSPACNIFSIKGTVNGGILYQGGKRWNKYLTYGNAFDGFNRLISYDEHHNYFNAGKYTISAIAPTYCNAAWGVSVSKIALEIMGYYTGTWETWYGNGSFGLGNDEFAKAAENCMNWLNKYKNSFVYGYGVKVPPYNGDFGVPRGSNMDCSGYVSWVIYEYGKANGIEALKGIGRWSTSNFKSLGDAIIKGKDYCGVAKYFEIIATRADMPGGSISKVADRLQAGDIILYKEGSGHHVEILKETGSTKVYTCGSKSGWTKPGTQSYTRRSDVTYIFRLKTGVQ